MHDLEDDARAAMRAAVETMERIRTHEGTSDRGHHSLIEAERRLALVLTNAAGWVSPSDATKLREELTAALHLLPSEESLSSSLDALVGEEAVKESADLDRIETGMELQDAIEGARDALNAALSLLPPGVTSVPIESVSKPLKPGWKVEASTESRPITTVHILKAGLAFCKFTDKLPRDWPTDQKWAHSVEELRRLRNPEVPCMECVRQDYLSKRLPK